MKEVARVIDLKVFAIGIALAVLIPTGCGSAGSSPGSAAEVSSFNQLGGYGLEMPPDGEKLDANLIPAPIQALDGKSARIKGYMMVLEFEEGRSNRFLLMKDQADCCFGGAAQLPDWIMVDMPAGKTSQAAKASEIEVSGTLRVGPQYSEEGWVHSVYQIVAEEVRTADGASLVEDI